MSDWIDYNGDGHFDPVEIGVNAFVSDNKKSMQKTRLVT